MSDEWIYFKDGVATNLTESHSEFFHDFYILFQLAINNAEEEDIRPSFIRDKEFILKKEDGGYLIIIPEEEKILDADENLSLLKPDFYLSYSKIVSVYDDLETRLFGEIAIEVVQTSPLSEGVEGLIITLNYFAELVIKAEAGSLDQSYCTVSIDTLYLRQRKGYLAIKPSGTGAERHFYVDNSLIPVEGLFSIDVAELKNIVIELEKRLIRARLLKPGIF